MDENGDPAPDGVPGELFVGGDGLARGYFNQPELTAERFVPHPSDSASGARLYRTGDLAKYLANGSLEHMGRVDFQVKVRGFRIELGEIEATLERHELVRQAVVLAREDAPGDKRLVAYIVPAKDNMPTIKDLRAWAGNTLPDYMVPGLCLFLEEFPLTPNGKVDRKALPAPDAGRGNLAEEYVAPRTQEETLLASIWEEVLRVDDVGVTDNFFERGGDSLKVAQMATRIRDAFNVDIHLRWVFDTPTVADLLPQILAAGEEGDTRKELSLRDVSRGDNIPLSFAQQRVWFIHQLNPDNLAYNFQSTMQLKGTLDVAALERTLDEILRRHEAYRTTYPMVDGQPVQIVHPATPYSLPIIDLADKPESEQQAAMKAFYDQEFQLRFDLTRLPLVRWTLIRISADESILVHMEHHLVHDGWSFNIFLLELVELYNAFAAGKSSPLPDLPIQFAEFATWQREWMQGDVSTRQLAYWKERFATIPPILDLPTKDVRPATQSFRGTSLRPEISLDLCNDLRSLGRKEGSTLFMTMLAGFIALLHRYTGEPDVAVGTFFANRRGQESEGLIGMILNNVVIRASLETNPTVREFMGQIRDLVLEGADYQDVPFDRVVENVQPERDLSHNPLFQVMFSFHDEPMPEHLMQGLEVKVTPVISNGSSKFDLGVIGIPHSAQRLGLQQGSENDGLTMIWEHNTDLFDTKTIGRMVEHYKSLLSSMVADPDQRISDLELCSEAERQEQIVEWNATDHSYPAGACIHDLIRGQASSTPDAVAVVDESQALSYEEIDKRSNQLAKVLRARNVGPDVLVGICVERSANMIVGLLGILKAGGAYVPIDPTFPKDRQKFMLEDAAIGVVVTEKSHYEGLPAEGVDIIRLDADADFLDRESDGPLNDVGVGPENLAYVIYTSGSTGRPKGVCVPHRSVVNFLSTMRSRPGMRESDRLFAVTTLSFDIAGLELYLPLTVGGRVIIGARDVVTNGQALARQLASTDATIMQATPATWQMLIESGWTGKADLTALCGGEALPRALANELKKRVKVLWNMYGPTETTIWSTIHRVESDSGPVPIGHPIGNTQVYLLDKYNNDVPVGVIGELCIGGAGVASGYLNRPELSDKNFVDNPVRGAPKEKIYRTGDLARFRLDGTLECLGRTDHQIKLRGFRIELGEIESLLAEIKGVDQAVVVRKEFGPGDERLVAYVVLSPGVEIASTELLSTLKGRLPEYMVPSTCMVLDAMPQTPNRKIDRRALPEPSKQIRVLGTSHVAPREADEEMVREIWEEVLGVSPIGVRDDFFDLGGHSLLAVRLVSEMEARTGSTISLADFLKGRTIESVTRVMRGDQDADPASDPGFGIRTAWRRFFGHERA